MLNAEHAMAEGGELIMTTRRDGRWIVLDVIDTGSGCPRMSRPDLRPLLLDPPRRQRSGPADHPEDRRIPRRHHRGGQRQGKGSRFSIRLPVPTDASWMEAGRERVLTPCSPTCVSSFPWFLARSRDRHDIQRSCPASGREWVHAHPREGFRAILWQGRLGPSGAGRLSWVEGGSHRNLPRDSAGGWTQGKIGLDS